jgi:hypothetical protein
LKHAINRARRNAPLAEPELTTSTNNLCVLVFLTSISLDHFLASPNHCLQPHRFLLLRPNCALKRTAFRRRLALRYALLGESETSTSSTSHDKLNVRPEMIAAANRKRSGHRRTRVVTVRVFCGIIGVQVVVVCVISPRFMDDPIM